MISSVKCCICGKGCHPEDCGRTFNGNPICVPCVGEMIGIKKEQPEKSNG